MKVEKIMSPDVKFCLESDNLNRAAQLMWENDCGFVPVIAGDGEAKLTGVLTDRDICMAAYIQGRPLFEIPVTSAMAHKVISCKAGDDIRLAEVLMKENRVRRLAVTNDQGALVGVGSINDLALEAERELGAGKGAPELAETEVAETLAAVSEHRAPRTIEQAAAA